MADSERSSVKALSAKASSVASALTSAPKPSIEMLLDAVELARNDKGLPALVRAFAKGNGLARLLRVVERGEDAEMAALAEEVVNACMDARDTISAGGFAAACDVKSSASSSDEAEDEDPLVRIVLSQNSGPRQLTVVNEPVTHKERQKSEIPTMLWPASKFLSGLVLDCDSFEGLEVLELGAGYHCLPSFSASSRGAASVLCTDMCEVALKMAARNAALNAKSIPPIDVCPLDWANPGPDFEGKTFDVVLGADVVHYETHSPLVLQCLLRFLKPGGVAVLVNGKPPYRDGIPLFKDLLSAEGSLNGQWKQWQAKIHDRPYDVYTVQWADAMAEGRAKQFLDTVRGRLGQ